MDTGQPITARDVAVEFRKHFDEPQTQIEKSAMGGDDIAIAETASGEAGLHFLHGTLGQGQRVFLKSTRLAGSG